MKIFKMIMAAALLISSQANANMITIDLDDTNVAVGETVNVSLFASFTDAVNVINFDFIFDTNLFSFVAGSETTPLPVDGIFDVFGAVANPLGVGLGYSSLFDVVTGDFLFASFQLERTQVGDTDFSLQSNEFLFDDFTAVENFLLDPVESVSVSSEVSAPATLGLFAMAIFAMGRLRRKA
ncbi:cohesin domain-containing protein [Paraglaciecola sp.]|uniref:cohesin domain-containing protein n=1 Tax=Paraglaciecola sp. TaxID=1920173 RepID=UPI003EF7DC8C